MSFYRQLLVFTVPSVAVLFGIYWYRRRRGFGNRDPGGSAKNLKSLRLELEEALQAAAAERKNSQGSRISSPARIVVKSAPIDIVPNGVNSQRSSPLELTDQQIDIEIEKARAQKLEMEGSLRKASKENTPPMSGKRSASPRGAQSPESTKMSKSSHSARLESPMSCLSEKLLSMKLTDTPEANRSHNKSIQPIEEEAKAEAVDVSKCDASKISEDVCNEVTKLTECVSERECVKENVIVDSIKPVENVETKCDKPLKSKKTKKTSSIDKKSNSTAEKKNSNTSDKKQFTGNDKSNKLELNNKNQIKLDMLSEQDTSSISTSEKENNHSSISSENEAAQNRDSANHSPFETMLASPSNGHFSDNHSEGSNDSGKGCSESPSPPPTNVCDSSQTSNFVCHQFIIPIYATGIIIGSKKSFLNKLNTATGAKVYIREHFESPKYNICSIEGTQQDVNIVLGMIRQKLPEKKFPQISLRDMSAELCKSEFSLLADCYNLNLVEGVNNDTIISCYVTPSQLFLQQPMHPTYPSLHVLHQLMGASYQDPTVPKLPPQVKEGMICAAPTANNWYRTQVINTNPENDTSLVKLVDFGGFMEISNSLLKQIRGDFMMLPFQATEVQLAHVAPIDGEEWAPEAVQIIAGLTSGQLLQAQVIGYNEDGLPQVYLYLTLGPQQVISLNQELVVRGLAKWVENES